MDYSQRMQTLVGGNSSETTNQEQKFSENPFASRMDALLRGEQPKLGAPPPQPSGAPQQAETETDQQQALPTLTVGRQEPKEMPLSEWGSEIVKDLPKKAYEAGKTFVEPFMNPAETWEGIKGLGKGVVSKVAGAVGMQQSPEQKAEDEAVADAFWELQKERYGSWPRIQRTVAENPFLAAADVSSVASLGGAGLARLPGILGKTGEAVQAVGRATDPIGLALKAPTLTAQIVSKPVNFGLWLQSGRPMSSFDTATQAGLTGNKAFVRHMSNGPSVGGELVEAVDTATNSAAKTASQKYIENYEKLNKGQPLKYDKIDTALKESQNIAFPKGEAFDPSSSKIQTFARINALLDNWKNKPNVSHDLERFDTLKKSLQDFTQENNLLPGSKEFRIVDNLRKAALDTLKEADPNYAKMTEEWRQAQDLVKSFRADLASGRTSTAKLRKLLSSPESPYKKTLIAELAKYDPDIPYMLAGQELNAIYPQGWRGWLGSVLTSGGLAGVAMHPELAAGVVLGSPRIGGNIAYRTGQVGSLGERVYGGVPQFTKGLGYQAGVLTGMDEIPPEEREQRATGGKVTGSIAQRLVAAAEKAHKYHQKTTEEILDAPDETVVKALAVAKKNI